MALYTNEPQRPVCEGEVPANAVRQIVSETDNALSEANEIVCEIMKAIAGGEPKGREIDKREIGCFFDECIEVRERAFALRERVLIVKNMLFG